MKISVIIPAYNIEKYLARALDSLIKTSLDDYEIIIVDDGSKDLTGRIADSYAQKYAFINVIHQKNAGAPAARNAAIELAKGDYVYFMDGDDRIEGDMLKEMYLECEKTHARLLITGFYIDTYTGENRYHREKKEAGKGVFDRDAFRKKTVELFDNNLLYTPWNKLFRRDRLIKENIRFRNTHRDDFPFCVDYIKNVETVALSDKAYYHFMRERAESETTRYYNGLYEKRVEEHEMLMELYKGWGMLENADVKEFLARRYVERIFGCIENVTCKGCPLSFSERNKAIKEMINDDYCRKSLKECSPHTLMVKIMLIPVKLRSVWLSHLMGSFISFVKRNFSGVFAKLKAER